MAEFPDAGIPIRTTMDNSTTVQYAGLLQRMVDQSRNSVRDMDPQDDLTFLRIRSKKHEIMIAPGKLTVALNYLHSGFWYSVGHLSFVHLLQRFIWHPSRLLFRSRMAKDGSVKVRVECIRMGADGMPYMRKVRLFG